MIFFLSFFSVKKSQLCETMPIYCLGHNTTSSSHAKYPAQSNSKSCALELQQEQNCRPGYDFHQFTYPYSQLLAHLSFFSPTLGLLAYAWVCTIVNFSANALVSPHTCIRQRETHRAPHNTSTRTGLFGDDDVEIARLERGYSGSSFISIVESVDCRVHIIVD